MVINNYRPITREKQTVIINQLYHSIEPCYIITTLLNQSETIILSCAKVTSTLTTYKLVHRHACLK